MTMTRKDTPKHVELGVAFGLIKKGWDIKDYLIYAVDNPDGLETCVIHGQQGSGKSNRALQYCAWIKTHTLTQSMGRPPNEVELWEAVLDSLVFSPSDFVKTLEAVPKGERLDCLVWDDIQLNYTSSTFKTDVKQYSAIDSMFAVIRTKVSVVIITLPNITRLPKNIKDNVTFESYIGKNRLEQIRKIFRLPGTRYIDSNLFKPILQPPKKFNIYDVPSWAWYRYEDTRQEIANTALAALRGVTDMENLEGYIPIVEARRLCREYDVNWSMSTLQQHVSRGVLLGQKVGGILHLDKPYLLDVLKAEIGEDA